MSACRPSRPRCSSSTTRCSAPGVPAHRMSPFAASAITGGKPIKTMWLTWRYTLSAFLVPFIFVLSDDGVGLLLQAVRGRWHWPSPSPPRGGLPCRGNRRLASRPGRWPERSAGRRVLFLMWSMEPLTSASGGRSLPWASWSISSGCAGIAGTNRTTRAEPPPCPRPGRTERQRTRTSMGAASRARNSDASRRHRRWPAPASHADSDGPWPKGQTHSTDDDTNPAPRPRALGSPGHTLQRTAIRRGHRFPAPRSAAVHRTTGHRNGGAWRLGEGHPWTPRSRPWLCAPSPRQARTRLLWWACQPGQRQSRWSKPIPPLSGGQQPGGPDGAGQQLRSASARGPPDRRAPGNGRKHRAAGLPRGVRRHHQCGTDP